MSNPFDQFDQSQGNPFDQFDGKERKSFFQRVGEDIQTRRENVAEIQAAKQRGGQGAIESGFQEAGNFAGLVNDVAGQGINSLMYGIGQADQKLTGGRITEPVKEAGRHVSDFVGNLPAFGGGTLAETIPSEINMLAENHPRAARNISAGANLGALLYATKPVNGKDVVDASARLTEKKIAPSVSSEQLRQVGGDLINKASKSGAVINPEYSTKFVDDIVKKVSPKGKWEGAATLKTEVDDIVNNLAELRGQGMSLEDAMGLESRLGKLAYSPKNYSMGKFTPEGKQLIDIKDSLQKMVESAADNEAIPSNVISQWREGQKLWSASIRARDLERVIENAQYMDHPATAIRVGMRNILKNPNKISKYSTKEVAAIKKAAKTGVVTDLLRLGGSGLGPIISGTMGGTTGALMGGPVGAAVGAAAAAGPSAIIREGSKALASSRQLSRAQKAYDTVAREAVGAPSKKLTMRQIMALPPEQAKFYLNQIKN